MTIAMFHPDLVACDLDGTLLSPDLRFSPGLPDALDALRHSGSNVLICTGRMLRSARRMAVRLGLHEGLIVCYQGAMVADLQSGEPLRHRRIDGDVAAGVVRHVRDLGRHLNAYVDDELFVEELDEWARRYADYADVEIALVDDLEALVHGRPPTKFVVLSDPPDVDALLPKLQDRWRGRLYVVRSQPTYIEITAPDVGKGRALAWACERLGARRKRTVACGDGHNDIDMLRWAGLGVAVAEAAPEVQAAAAIVVPRDELPQLLVRLAAAERD